MRARGVVLVLTLALSACDPISFVALDDPRRVGFVSIRSLHDADLVAAIRAEHRGFEDRVEVRVDGVPASIEDQGEGRWVHSVELSVDSLRPVVEVDIDAGASFEATRISVHLLSRSGPARWSPNGDLVLPVVFHPSLPESGADAWAVNMSDSAGSPLLELRGHGELPQPLVLGGGMVPDHAVAAEVTVRSGAGISRADYPLTVALRSTARVAVPPRQE